MNINKLTVFEILCVMNSTRFHIPCVALTKYHGIAIGNQLIIYLFIKLNGHPALYHNGHIITRVHMWRLI